MKKFLVFIATLVLAVVPVLVFAQQQVVSTKPIVALYDLDSTSDVACTVSKLDLNARIVTSGSSTTVTALTSGTLPFNKVAVGDVIYSNLKASTVTSASVAGRVVTAKASGDSLTVDTAWDLGSTGTSFTVWKPNCNAVDATNPGWISIASNKTTNVVMQIDQMSVASGGIGLKIEGFYGNPGDSYLSPVNIWPGEVSASANCFGGTFSSGYCVFTSAGITARPNFSTANIVFPSAIRVVMKLTGADDGGDTGSNIEKVTVHFTEIK